MTEPPRLPIGNDSGPLTPMCRNCGHRHAGAVYGWICVGCPCVRYAPEWPKPSDPPLEVAAPVTGGGDGDSHEGTL